MWKFYLFVFIIVCFVIFIEKFKFRQKLKTDIFIKKNFLLNVPERIFFEFMQKNIPDNYVIFPQINLRDLVKVKNKRKNFYTHHNKINKKIVDFVIFEKKYLKPMLVIEYDGQTHNRADRKERDNFVNNVLNSVNIKIKHIQHRINMDFEIIKNEIIKILN